jgi:ribosomal protein S18 acetylase RimI-like enzyme
MRIFDSAIVYLAIGVVLVCVDECRAFAVPSFQKHGNRPNNDLAERRQTSSGGNLRMSSDPAPVELVMSDNENFLNAAGALLVDAFWLHSIHHQIDTSKPISDEARIGLIVEQSSDLQEKYGERMGTRLTRGAVIGALDPETKAFIGVVTLKETLMKIDNILEAEQAENIAKTAVASLGPKQRRLYKDAPVATIAEELLPADTKSVCVLSNLAVSPDARRRGVANALCSEVELLTSDWGYDELHLLVEEANAPGRKLYEEKLGYTTIAKKEDAVAVRADIELGEFQEVRADTLVMVKKV